MSKSKSSIELSCHPEAPRSLHEFTANYNWALKNYSKLVEKHGRLKYVAIYDCEVVEVTNSDNDMDRIELLNRLDGRFSEEQRKSICIIPL